MKNYLSEKVYEFVSQIPAGKVATYGQIAKLAGTGPRVVGNILHKNTDPANIPCHRVVNAKGELSSAFAFGGKQSQYEKLRKDGIIFSNGKINLSNYEIDLINPLV
ncbi:MAG: MGMT family protein [Patescibacteria group bacterium]